MAKELEAAGTHVLGIKDMAGLMKPAAARKLVAALKNEVSVPIHFHTHDTSGISAASVIAAAEAGVDAADAAMDAFSGLTSQPPMGSIVEALRGQARDTGLDPAVLRSVSDYWEQVRAQYVGFETDMKAPAAEVYLHEMPGGQFTNLKAQARSIGLEDKWPEVAKAYAEANAMFGDIVKVTPSSKVVGDMALMMVTQGLTRADVENPDRDMAFPESVVGMMRGDLGCPPGGWPEALRKKILKGDDWSDERPGARLPPVDLEAVRAAVSKELEGKVVDDEDLASYLMYPKVYLDYMGRRREFGPVRQLPTPIFFYGMEPGQEITVDLEAGKTLVVRLSTIGDRHEGEVRVFFELNGQPRTIRVPDRLAAAGLAARPKGEPGNPAHVAAPLPGVIASVAVEAGQKVKQGDLLLTIEAMKMETALHADRDGTVKRVLVHAGAAVDAKDLLVELEK
jgi:pyruvate carboxylase